MNLNQKELILYLISDKVEFLGIENNLPKGYTPKIKINVLKHTVDEQDVMMFKPIKMKKLKKKFRDGEGMELLSDLEEDINIPVKVGDTVLMGKFKNKKVKIKSIGKDEHGMPTINGKKATTFRIHNIVNIFDDVEEDVNIVKRNGKDSGDYRIYTTSEDSDIEQPYKPKKKLKKNKSF